MSRIDSEYDPAEHHDLDRIDRNPPDYLGGPETFTAVCACGWTSTAVDGTNRDHAWRGWDRHRHQEWFG